MTENKSPTPDPTGPPHVSASAGVAVVSISAVGAGAVVSAPARTIQPPFLVTSTVTVLGSVPDGQLVDLVEPAWRALLDLFEKDPSARFQIPPRQLEELIAASYKAAGFDEVVLTPRSGDYGRDVIATKAGFAQIRILDQVKAFKANHLVDANDVRALIGVLHADQNATKGLVTTTSDFAPLIQQDPSIKPFIPYRLELISGERLLQRLAALQRDESRHR